MEKKEKFKDCQMGKNEKMKSCQTETKWNK